MKLGLRVFEMPNVSFLTIDRAPNKTNYRAGDKFEKYGMVVTVHYDDSTTATVDFYMYSPVGPLSTSDTQITISAFDKTVTQSITVSQAPSTGYFLDKCLNNATQGENPYINTADGSISFYNNPITVERDSYRIDLVLSYHSRMTDRESDLISGFFKGFRTNYHQFLIQDGKDSNNVDTYKYIDGDGYIHTFIYNSDIQRYHDKEGNGLFLNVSNRTITDSKDNVLTFDSRGRLISIQNGRDPLNTKVITYSSDGIRTIYDNRNPNTYIKFSYNYSFLQYIRVYYESELLKTYTIYGFFGQISSIDETVGSSTRTLYQYSVNDRDRINRIVDCLTKEAYRITYDFDFTLNDYRFSSFRNGYVENDTFVEQKGLFFVDRKCEANATNKLIYELVISDSNGVELSYMTDSNGGPVAVYEQDPQNPGTYLSLIRDAGEYIPFQGDCADSISDSQSKLFNTSLITSEGLSSSALDGSPYIKLIGYIKINSHPKRAKFFVENSHLKCRFVDINPDAYSVWQYFEMPIERQVSNNSPVSFSSFVIKLLDENNNQINAEVCNLQFVKSQPKEKLLFKGGLSSSYVDFDELQYLTLLLENNNTEVIDMFSSDLYITEKDLLNTHRWKYHHQNEGSVIFLNDGKRIKKYVDGFRITDIHNYDLAFFGPSYNVDNSTINGTYNWFFATSIDANSRSYYRFTSSYYEIIARNIPTGNNQTPEDTVTRYDYNDDVIKETNKFGNIADYEYFSDGRLKKKTITTDPNSNPVSVVVYEAILDSNNRNIQRTIQERKSFDYFYNNCFLERVKTNHVNDGQVSSTVFSVKRTRDNFLSDISKVEYLKSAVINEEHNYSRPSTSYKTNYIDDGVTNYRISRNINNRTVTLGVHDGNDYVDIFTIKKANTYVETTYNNSYGNNSDTQAIKETFDAYGNPSQILYNNNVMVSYSYEYNWASQYDARPETITDSFSNRNIAFTYGSNNEVSSVQIGSFEISYYSDNSYSCIKHKYNSSEEYVTQGNQDEVLTKKGGNTISSSHWKYGYDELLRLSSKTNSSFNPSIVQEYSYNSDYPSLIKSYKFNGNTYSENYTFNTKGQLAAISVFVPGVGVKAISFAYDGFGRVTSQSSLQQTDINKTFTYKEDDGTPGKIGRMEKINDTAIGYDNRGRLISFGNNTYTYDEYGNRKTKNNDIYQWTRGRLLASLGTVSFTYDYQGIRTTKVDASGLTHQFYYEKDTLVGEDVYNGNSLVRKLRYFYDKDGLCSFRVIENNQTKDYIYIRNAFNNIVGIIEGTTLKALYFYDVWGNHTVRNPDWTINNNSSFIGNINPFRYRSYYFDSDISLYYLKTRYYDPEICQFISPDEVDYLDLLSISGVNLYSYCNNNPVMYYDPDGRFILGLLIIIFASTFPATFATLTALYGIDYVFGSHLGILLYYVYNKSNKIQYNGSKLVIKDGYFIIGFKTKLTFLGLASQSEKYKEAFDNAEYRNIGNYLIEWVAHNIATYSLSYALVITNVLGFKTLNNWLIGKINQAKDVDMEDEEDWWDLWKRIVS